MTESSFTSAASFAQERLWFLEELASGLRAYGMASAVRLRGPLDVAALERALGAIVVRHEALRTTFQAVDGVPVQIVSKPGPFSLPVVDVRGEELLATHMSEESGRGFDLERGPLFRGVLYRLGADEHVLLLLVHHIVADAWSTGVLLRELAVLYGDFVSGREASLPELPIQYADYAEWQRDWLRGEALETQLEYWRRQLAGAPRVLDLPTDRPRPPVETHRGTRHPFLIHPELLERVSSFARHEGVTVFMTLVAAFEVLLGRHTGQQDLLIGTPVTNRGRTELEGLIGFFVNTLVLRGDLSGNPTVVELLGRVRKTCLEAYANQDLPFEKLVEQLQPTRDLSRNPLFQIMLVFHNAPVVEDTLSGLSMTPVDVDRGVSQMDLTLHVEQRPDGLRGIFEFATDLFDEDTISRMAGHFVSILDAMVASPTLCVSDLPLLTDAERRQLLVEWNDTAAAVPLDTRLHELVEAQAARFPDRPAVASGATVVAYAELESRAMRLAQVLRARGVGRGQLIGLCLERSADMLAAILGILKTGAAYVPLDPAFPEERLRFMADDAGLAVLVSTSALARTFGVPRDRQLLLDGDRDALALAPATPLPADASAAQPEDPAYVIYTSGSTGRPKGVVVPHRAVVNFLTSMAREPGLSSSDRLVAVTTLSFDIAVLELLLPLSVGAEVILASRDEASDGEALLALLDASHATVMQATPATWRLLIDAGWTAGGDIRGLVGGESLPPDLAEQLTTRTSELWNLYGPTETTVWSTCWRVRDPRAGISIGRPIANTTVRVLNANGQLCPIGVPGEIYIGGAGLALGYLHRAELTAERFLPDPFATMAGACLYRTGDSGRWLANGTLEHLGRLDFQVKLRGFRIELGEIETALERNDAVRQAVVIVRGGLSDESRLVAYVTFRRGASATGSELRRFLRNILPEYMLPNLFVELDELPLTNNGKINRLALPPPDDEPRRADADFMAPRSEREKAIAEVWRDVLGVPRISIRDNFFELGGHSLLAAQMVARLARNHGYRVGLRSVVFETLEQLAAGVEPL